MQETRTDVRVGLDLELSPAEAFEVLVEEIGNSLAAAGMAFEAGADGRVTDGATEVGSVVSWRAGEGFKIRWRQADWEPDEVTEVELRLDRSGERTRVTLEHRGWGRLTGDARELAGWFSTQVAGPFLRATAPSAFGDWFTDRRARRPTGAQSRAVYADPLHHYPNFRVILKELALDANDYLLEVGCGGGALLKEALESGCRAAAIDHSPDMVRLARERNREAVSQGRLEIRLASASRLPFADGTFTCAVMTGVLGFLPDPVAALKEIRRTLRTGGRIVVLGSDPALAGTPAAPEPMASRLRFYNDEEFRLLAVQAGFPEAVIVSYDLEPYAREAGVPEDHIPLFRGATAFLIAGKTSP